MTVNELIQSTKSNIQDLSKLFIGLFSEIAKNEKFLRKKFKKKVQKDFEKKYWFIMHLSDLDTNLKIKELKNNKNIKKSEIEKLENDLNETKKGLALFFEQLKKPKQELDYIENKESACFEFETKNNADGCEEKTTS